MITHHRHSYRRFLSVLPLLVLLPLLARSQGTLTVRTVVAPVNALSINDIDFLNSTTPKWLFTVTVDAGGRNVQAVLTLHLDARLASGEIFQNAVYLVTKPFAVEPVRTFTNLDIRSGGPIRDSIYTVDAAARQKFEEIALPGGVMPAGDYQFHVTAQEVGGPESPPSDFSIVLTNPTTVELIFPFDGDPSVNQFPLFQWQFNGQRSTIAVYEKLPNQTTLEEAASGVPQLTADVTTSSFQYPSAGVRALEPGRTYVWFVEGHVASSDGADLLIRSSLRSFTVAEPGTPSLTSILYELENALGPKYKAVFDQIRSEGLSPTGTIRLNGSPVSPADLVRIVNKFRQNPDNVTGVGLQ